MRQKRIKIWWIVSTTVQCFPVRPILPSNSLDGLRWSKNKENSVEQLIKHRAGKPNSMHFYCTATSWYNLCRASPGGVPSSPYVVSNMLQYQVGKKQSTSTCYLHPIYLCSLFKQTYVRSQSKSFTIKRNHIQFTQLWPQKMNRYIKLSK